MTRIKRRVALWIAGILLFLQSLVITADFIINTLFFDELFSWLITAALAWLISYMVKIEKTKNTENS